MALLFLVCMPLSWYAAWDASSSFLAVAFSLVLPTWGLALWGLSEVFGAGFGIGAGSFILGMIGAFVSLMLFKVLDPDGELTSTLSP
jgi:hypothetical protein